MSFGRPYIMRTSGCIHDGWLVLRDKTGLFEQDFLYYFLGSASAYKQFDSLASGSTVRNLNIGLVKKIQVPLPPLLEQKRIVTILNEAFAGIDQAVANTEKNLTNAREVFEGYLDSSFDIKSDCWDSTQLKQLGKTQTGTTPKTSQSENFGSFIPFIKPSDFYIDGRINYNNMGLSEKGLEKSRFIKAESVLMVCIGATIGKVGFNDRNISVNQQINCLTPFEGILPKFLYYQMRTSSFQRAVLNNAGQATLPIINKTKWNNLTALIPKKQAEQQRIVAELDLLHAEIQHLESIYQKKLTALAELKQSILQKAFTGGLTQPPEQELVEVC